MKKTMKLASRGKRFAAGMIDAAIPVIVYIIMTTVLGFSSMMSSPYGNGFGGGFNDYGYGYGYNYNYRYSSGSFGTWLAIIGCLLIVYIVAEFVLYARAQSIGKAILGLQVVSSKDGKPFSFWYMVLRECVVKGASSSVFGLGYIWILIDDKNRSWHDKILDSYVVDLKETERMYQRVMAPVEAPKPVEPQPAEPKIEAPKPVEPKPVEEQPKIEAPADVPKIEVRTEQEAPEKPAEPKAEQPKPAEPKAEQPKPVEPKAETPVATIMMNRDELLKIAKEKGIEIRSGATKPEIIEKINEKINEEINDKAEIISD